MIALRFPSKGILFETKISAGRLPVPPDRCDTRSKGMLRVE